MLVNRLAASPLIVLLRFATYTRVSVSFGIGTLDLGIEVPGK